jgi:MFS family permease
VSLPSIEIIYLHQFRGFGTATAGLVLAAILGSGTLVSPPAGTLLDRFRPKPILIAGNPCERARLCPL